VDVGRLRTALLAAVPPSSGAATPVTHPPLGEAPTPTPTLDRFGRDLTALARRGELGLVVGRRREILAVLQVLGGNDRRSSPLLVGDAGVGKTAIVEAIATRAAEGRDPVALAGKRIVELRVDTLLGGNERRTVLEERVQGVLAEARANPHVVLFIDDIEALVADGAPRPDGLDVAELL
jgi:ATP-dependent Clp protease ATP-binding subunit ClpC